LLEGKLSWEFLLEEAVDFLGKILDFYIEYEAILGLLSLSRFLGE
jgi:hypothetical protein